MSSCASHDDIFLFTMKIIVFGPQGLLGEACCRVIGEHADIIPVGRALLDLSNTSAISQFLDKTDYDVIVNAAAMTSLEGCLDEPELSELVNVEAPAVMAEHAKKKGARFIHISTDYVFSGEEDRLCDESMDAQPVNVYGKTKLESENRVIAVGGSAIVARVSWIFGRGRESFVDQVVACAKNGAKKPCIGDKYSIPNYADDLAQGILQLIDKVDSKSLSGVVHLCCDADPESWYSYGEKVLETALKLGLISNQQEVLERQYLAEAHFFRELRPKHTAMRPRRLKEEFGLSIRHWHVGLEEFLGSI